MKYHVKYLPSFGWRPVVLTPRHPVFGHFDHTLVDEIPPEARVYQTTSLEPPRFYAPFKERYINERETGDSPVTERSWLKMAFTSLIRPILKSMRWVAHNLVFVPDTHVGWIPFAVWKGVNLVKKERIDAIYATGDPWSDFLSILPTS